MDEFSTEEIMDMRGAFLEEDASTPLSEASEAAQQFVCAIMDTDMYLSEAEHEAMLMQTIGEIAPYVESHFDIEDYYDDNPYDLDDDFWDSYDPE